MNYRHAYHVGNFADVFKHIVLTRVLSYMKRKDAPFFILDTHSGCGLYELDSVEAGKTLEWQGGIARFLDALPHAPKPVKELVAPYAEIINKLNPDGGLTLYPGSPEISAEMMRLDDRLSLVELHPEDFAVLDARFGRVKGIKTQNMDGWIALKAQMPPKERRAVVLIDPPYEVTNEFDGIIVAAIDALKRFATGTYVIWYPVKNEPLVKSFRQVMKNNIKAEMLDIVFKRENQGAKQSFVGTGMLVINPPYVLADEMKILMPWLTTLFETQKGRGSWSVTVL